MEIYQDDLNCFKFQVSSGQVIIYILGSGSIWPVSRIRWSRKLHISIKDHQRVLVLHLLEIKSKFPLTASLNWLLTSLEWLAEFKNWYRFLNKESLLGFNSENTNCNTRNIFVWMRDHVLMIISIAYDIISLNISKVGQ